MTVEFDLVELKSTQAPKVEYYSNTAAVGLLNSWYRSEKEEAFLDFIFRDLIIPPTGPVVEIGGGAGLHGLELQRRLGDRYVHTDISQPLADSARRKGVRSGVADGLATPFRDNSVAAVLLVGTSTIISGEELRMAQFRECARVLMAGGVCIMVTSVLSRLRGQHRLNRRDAGILGAYGLQVAGPRRWGVIPGRLWRRPVAPVLAGIEGLCAAAGLGIRQIVVARKA